MANLSHRSWVPAASEAYVQSIAAATAAQSTADIVDGIESLIAQNRRIHELECVNLNPATNVMNPRAEAALSSGLGTRVSLGYPGNKYEMGLEAVEQIEVIAAELAAEVFGSSYAEVRVASGAMANLYAFMACARPGDAIIVPPATIGGHVTHHAEGAAGLYGLDIHPAPVNRDGYTIDVAELSKLASRVHPRLISIGGSLNLFHHPVTDIRAIADQVGAKVLFDAAHLSGVIAGGAWPNPLAEGAHLMTMSTYKSLGGPPSGLLLTNDSALAERVDAIAFPGMTANFDVAKTAALAITLVDWKVHGQSYALEMCRSARALANELVKHGLAIFAAEHGCTQSHQLAIVADDFGGGEAAAKKLRVANVLTSGIGLPTATGEGLRLGMPEAVRWGMTADNMAELGSLVARGLTVQDPALVATDVTAFRQRFSSLHFVS